MRHTGSVYLFARAVLENPRNVPGNINSIIFDATIQPCGNDPVPILCSFRYPKQSPHEDPIPGVYDICAKVQ